MKVDYKLNTPLATKEVPFETVVGLLSDEAVEVYKNRINSTPESKLRYLQCIFKEDERDEKLKWIIKRFSAVVGYFRGTYGPFMEMELLKTDNRSRGVFFIWLVLKDEFHLTKEEFNELIETI